MSFKLKLKTASDVFPSSLLFHYISHTKYFTNNTFSKTQFPLFI